MVQVYSSASARYGPEILALRWSRIDFTRMTMLVAELDSGRQAAGKHFDGHAYLMNADVGNASRKGASGLESGIIVCTLLIVPHCWPSITKW